MVALVVVAFAILPTRAIDEPLRALRSAKLGVETGPQPDIDLEAPPSAYPLKPVEQIAFRGARHGLVNTTTGTIAFQTLDLRLPGRMPIEMTRVFDTSISIFMPPPPPQQQNEPRWTYDLGKNWILGYAAYLVPIGGGVVMATPEGDLLWWNEGAGGVFTRQNDVPTKHAKLQRQSSTVIYETQLDGSKWTYTWQAIAGGNAYALTKVEDRSGNNITVTYTQGYISKIQNSDGAYVDVFRPIYDANYPTTVFPRHRVTKLTDSTGRIVRFDFNSAGLLTKVTDARGKDWTFTYSWDDKVETATDPLGNVYLNATYDSQHRVATYEADAGTWTFNYAAGTNKTSATDAFGNAWLFTRNASGVTTVVEEPEGGTYSLTLDSANNPIQYSGPESESASWTYDANHRPTAYRPIGVASAQISYVYDSTKGWVNSITNLSGGQTVFTRDSMGRVTLEQDPVGGKTTATYGAKGDRLTTKLPNGNEPGAVDDFQWAFTYNGFGDATTVTDPTGRPFLLEYDSRGNRSKIRRPDHIDPGTGQYVYADWATAYDVCGNVTLTTNPLGHSWTRTYDDAGRLVAIDGPAGTKRRYSWDARFRLTAVTVYEDGIDDPTTTLTYDAAGHVVTKSLPEGGLFEYGYDDSGRRTSVRDPIGRLWTYTRDLAGRIVAIQYPNGRSVTTQRDSGGRVLSRTYPGGRTESYTYDGVGRLHTVDVDEGTGPNFSGASIEYGYDLLSRPTRVYTDVVLDGSGSNRELTFSYDKNGNRVRMEADAYAPEQWVDYQYDELDRVVRTTSSIYGTTWLAYDGVNGYPTNVSFGMTYPTAGEIEGWTFDLAGRVLAISQTEGGATATQTRSLDAEGRVLSETRAEGEVSTTTDYTYGYQGQPTAIVSTGSTGSTTTILTYDSNGRPVSRAATGGGSEDQTATMVWDAAGRPIEAGIGSTWYRYSWDDDPTDPRAATAVWRATDQSTRRAAEIAYGYDGRLQSVYAHHYSESSPKLILKNLWAPFEADTILADSVTDENGTIQKRQMWLDVVGAYGLGGSTSNPVNSVSDSAMLLERVPGPKAEFLEAGLRMDWPNLLDADRGGFGRALSGEATAMGTNILLGRTVMGTGALSTTQVGYFEPIAPAKLDYVDSVLGQAINSSLPPSGFDGRDIEALSGLSSSAISEADRPVATHSGVEANPSATGVVTINICGHGVTTLQTRELWDIPRNCDYTIFEILLDGGVNDSCEQPAYLSGTQHAAPPRYPAISDGNVVLQTGSLRYPATDLTAWDPYGGIAFERRYDDSGETGLRALGWRWVPPFQEKLEHKGFSAGCSPDYVRWTDSDGNDVFFVWDYQTLSFNRKDPGYYRIRQNGECGAWEILALNGEVRCFNEAGQLIAIEDGEKRTSFTYTGFDLTGVHTHGVDETPSEANKRFSIEYESRQGHSVIHRVATGDRDVVYDYDACMNLTRATWSGVALGWDKSGNALTEQHNPAEAYYYTGDAADPKCNELRFALDHRLTGVRRRTFDPLQSAPESDGLDLLAVEYNMSPQGGADPSYGKVARQCLARTVAGGAPTCPAGAEDLAYTWSVAGADGRFLNEVWVDDYRTCSEPRGSCSVGSGATRARNEFDVDHGWLTKLTEDGGTGGLGRQTTYVYDANGRRTRIKRADGTCTEFNYGFVAGMEVPLIVRERKAGFCSGQPPDASDLVTAYTYEDVRGRVASVTRPEAFPTGVVPNDFDPRNGSYPIHTTFYAYDFNQKKPSETLPVRLASFATNWGLLPPRKLGLEVDNGDPTDDDHWSGALVETKIYNGIGTDPYMRTKRSNQRNGRPKKITGPDGVSEVFYYYASGVPGEGAANWDWRQGAGNGTADGAGPLARIVVESSGEPPQSILKSRFAWNRYGEETARQRPSDPVVLGVRTETHRNEAGAPLEVVVCAPTTETPSCAASNANDNVLSAKQVSYDLLGRTVRVAERDRASLTGGLNPLKRVTWMTYDALGSQTSLTVDPDDGVAPGDAKPSPPGTALHLVNRQYFNRAGHVLATRSPEGRIRCYNYDGLGYLRRATAYDVMIAGHPDCGTMTGDSVTVQTDYDAMGRVFRAIDGNGTKKYSWFDAFGRKVAESDGTVPSGVGAVNPILLDPAVPLPQNSSNWYRHTTYSKVGLPIRQRFYGRNGSGASAFLAAAWSTYDDLRRPTEEYARVLGPDVPQAVADLTAISDADADDDNLAGTEVVYRADGKVQKQLQRKAAGGTRESEITYDSFGRVDVTYGPEFNGHRDSADMDYDPTTGQQATVRRTYYDPEPGSAHMEEATPSYDIWGRSVRTEGEVGAHDAVTTVTLDAFSRPIETVKRWEDLTSYTGYHPQDQITKLEYDAAGRVKKSRQRQVGSPEAWADTVFGYSDDGLRTSLTDARTKTTSWEYDEVVDNAHLGGLGRLRRMKYPSEDTQQAVVWYEDYDNNGNPEIIWHLAEDNASAKAVKWTQAFDEFDRMTSRTAALVNHDPLVDPKFYGTTTQTFTYDDRGLLVKAVDTSAGQSPADVIAEFAYNVGGMVTEETQYFSGTPVNKRLVTSTYNKEAFREKLKYPVSWDSSGTALDRYALTYVPDALGRLETITGPTDSLEPLAGSTRATTTLASYRWAGSNLWDRKYEQNGADLRLYDGTRGSPGTMLVDALGRLTGMRAVDSAAGGEPVVTDLRYGYNRVGDRTWEQRRHEPMTNGFRTRAFIPDQAGRLDELRMGDVTTGNLNADDPASMITAGTGGNRTGLENWTLDSVGNWTTKITDSGAGESTESFTPNNLNQLVALTGPNGTKSFGFDWLGQMRQNDDRGQKMIWDAFGRLTQVYRPGTPDTLIATYRYDALNRRVQKHLPNGPAPMDVYTRFVYDGWKIIEERTAGVDPQYEKVRARYGYGSSMSEVLWMDRDALRKAPSTDTDPLDPAGSPNGTLEFRAYLHADALGSVIAVTDKSRAGGGPGFLNVIERFDYSAYGRRTALTGAWTCSGTCGYERAVVDGPSLASLPIGYTGHYWDRETGLWYARNRYYDDKQGRFVSRDPLFDLRREDFGAGDSASLAVALDGPPRLSITRGYEQLMRGLHIEEERLAVHGGAPTEQFIGFDGPQIIREGDGSSQLEARINRYRYANNVPHASVDSTGEWACGWTDEVGGWLAGLAGADADGVEMTEMCLQAMCVSAEATGGAMIIATGGGAVAGLSVIADAGAELKDLVNRSKARDERRKKEKAEKAAAPQGPADSGGSDPSQKGQSRDPDDDPEANSDRDRDPPFPPNVWKQANVRFALDIGTTRKGL
jgi:RHS repeat-associated protein